MSVFCQLGMAGKYGRLCQQMRKSSRIHCAKTCISVLFKAYDNYDVATFTYIAYSTTNASPRQFSELCDTYETVYVPFI